jgi:hypothetical protein
MKCNIADGQFSLAKQLGYISLQRCRQRSKCSICDGCVKDDDEGLPHCFQKVP